MNIIWMYYVHDFVNNNQDNEDINVYESKNIILYPFGLTFEPLGSSLVPDLCKRFFL